jgi:hypothetical protein
MHAISDFATELEEVHYSPGYIAELEQKINSLEHQNNCLKQYQLESEKFKLELKEMTSLKEEYEQRYEEASIKLLCIEDDDSLIFSETEQMKTLNQKISILIHANEDLRKELEKSYLSNKKITEERNEFKNRISQLEKLLGDLNQTKTLDRNFIDGCTVIGKDQESRIFEILFKTEDQKISQDHVAETPKKSFTREISMENLNKNSLSPIFEKSPRSSMNNNILKISVSPLARNINTPKLSRGRVSPFRTSPKLKHSKKKSQYMPSFMRKPFKVSKKLNV